jgi:hypothetical protein
MKQFFYLLVVCLVLSCNNGKKEIVHYTKSKEECRLFLCSFGSFDCRSLLWLLLTVWVLPKAGNFSTKVQLKNEC